LGSLEAQRRVCVCVLQDVSFAVNVLCRMKSEGEMSSNIAAID
jgi:hypothetical protein